MIDLLVVLLLSYLAGSIPSSIIAGKLLRGRGFDIREHGSGNAGATNVARILGLGPGLLVMAFDGLKGFAASAWIARWPWAPPVAALDPATLGLLAGGAYVLGHAYPIFAGFAGGKGMATMSGSLLAVMPLGVLVGAVVFALTLALTGYVSVASMVAVWSLPIVLAVAAAAGHPPPAALWWFAGLAPLCTLFLHRANLHRLLHGEENRFQGARILGRPAGSNPRERGD
jgi:glycerol-3-phosphate acyltransferase PlsY